MISLGKLGTWDDLRKILSGGQSVAKVHSGEVMLRIASTP